MPDTHIGLGGIGFVLGGNVFGWTIGRDDSFAVLDAFYEAGGRAIDTAEAYSEWVPGNKGGESEAIIGEWMELRCVRKDMRIATKTGGSGVVGGLAPDKVAAAMERSLDRLRTDYVDLYYVHRDDNLTSPEQVAAGYNALVATGKARELGVSNTTAERLSAFNAAARASGGIPFTVLQPGYSLIWRSEYAHELEELAIREGMAVLPYFGLAAGFLTGKYRSEADFGDSFRHQNARMFATEAAWKALPVLEAVSTECGGSMAQVALAWLVSRPAVWGPLSSATTVEQLHNLLGTLSISLTTDQLARLTAVSVDA